MNAVREKRLPVTASCSLPCMVLCLWREALTWEWDAVPVPRHIVVQSEQQHPHGQGEHTSQEAVENQVEQQDEAWRRFRGKSRDRKREST